MALKTKRPKLGITVSTGLQIRSRYNTCWNPHGAAITNLQLSFIITYIYIFIFYYYVSTWDEPLDFESGWTYVQNPGVPCRYL